MTHRLHHRATLVLMLAAGAAALVSGAARAGTHNTAGSPHGSARAAARFWTPALERRATPLELPAPLFADPIASLQPSLARDESNQQAFTITSSGWSTVKDVGKIYFNFPDDPAGYVHYCTGTLVAPNVVMTAGHCVYDPHKSASGLTTIGFSNQWAFVPEKWGSQEPDGRWYGVDARVPNEWKNAVDAGNEPYAYDYDYGFIKLAPNNQGYNAGDVVGTTPILANYVSSYVWAVGYPAGGWFGQWSKGEGTWPFWCYSPYADSSPTADGGYTIGMGCYMTGGASGGPWFGYADGSWNHLVSVNSHCWPNGCPTGEGESGGYSRNMWGPWLTNRVYSDLGEALQ